MAFQPLGADSTIGHLPAIVEARVNELAQAIADALTAADIGAASTADITTAINALGLSTAATRPATDFATPASVTSAVSAEVTARNAAITAAINTLTTGAPALLDTLAEIDAAIGNDPNFATTMTTALATKVNSSTYTAGLASKADASTLTAHTGNTSNPHAVTKAQVGLGNVDNTSDAAKPISVAETAALALKREARGSYLGPVANRGRIPAGVIGTGTYRQIKSWRVYRATDKIDAIELIYPGFAGTNEAAATAPGVVNAVVEYPVGTFTRIKTNAAIPAGGMSAVAALTTLTTTIPAGARFWIGTLVTWDAALQGPRFQDGMNFDATAAAAMRESAAASGTVTLTDDLMTGTRANANISSKTGDTYGPCAILGMTQKPTVFIAGDSRSMGQFPPVTSSQDAEGITGEIEQLLGNRIGYINAGLNSDSHGLANAGSSYANRLALSAYCTHIIDQYGVNSIYGQNLALNTSDLTTFRAKFPATKPYYKTTTTPKVSGNMILADLSDQTPVATLANYTGWNTFVRSGANGLIDGCIDLEAVTSASLNSGKVTPAQRVVTDAAMTSGSGVLTSATANFQQGDVGKFVAVPGAGAAAATLFGLIGVVTNTTTVTLTTNDSSALTAGTTVTGATAGIGLSSYDGVHQTRLREVAIRESQLLQRAIGPIIGASR